MGLDTISHTTPTKETEDDNLIGSIRIKEDGGAEMLPVLNSLHLSLVMVDSEEQQQTTRQCINSTVSLPQS